MGPGGPCPLSPLPSDLLASGENPSLKEFSFCDQKVTDAEPLVEGPAGDPRGP